MNIKQYQINVDAQTAGGLTLPSGWYLTIIAVSKENDTHRIVVQTCIDDGGSPPGVAAIDGHYENTPDGVKTYAYNPSTDNSKSENAVIKNGFEADLDTWFGAENWSTV